jgi:hypothetical protein
MSAGAEETTFAEVNLGKGEYLLLHQHKLTDGEKSSHILRYLRQIRSINTPLSDNYVERHPEQNWKIGEILRSLFDLMYNDHITAYSLLLGEKTDYHKLWVAYFSIAYRFKINKCSLRLISDTFTVYEILIILNFFR